MPRARPPRAARDLGVRGRVLAQLALVVAGPDDLAADHDHGTDGHVVVLERPLGLADGEAHEALVGREELGRPMSRLRLRRRKPMFEGVVRQPSRVDTCSTQHDAPPRLSPRRPRARSLLAPAARGGGTTCPARSSSATRPRRGAAQRRVSATAPRTRVVTDARPARRSPRRRRSCARRAGVAERHAELHRARELHPERSRPRARRRAAGRSSSGTSPGRSASTRPTAWDNVAAPAGPAARGVVVAVLDTGVAYADRGRFRRSPDLRGNRFVRGYDFVDDDRYPNDENGHGTHVASTIAESNDNGDRRHRPRVRRARSCPCACSTAGARATASAIAKGIRFAAKARRRRDQPLVRVRRRRHAAPDPRHPRRARATRAASGVARRRRVRQRPRARASPTRPRADDVLCGRRDDRARLPRRVLQQGPDARPRRAGRRRRRRARRRPELPPARRSPARDISR